MQKADEMKEITVAAEQKLPGASVVNAGEKLPVRSASSADSASREKRSAAAFAPGASVSDFDSQPDSQPVTFNPYDQHATLVELHAHEPALVGGQAR